MCILSEYSSSTRRSAGGNWEEVGEHKKSGSRRACAQKNSSCTALLLLRVWIQTFFYSTTKRGTWGVQEGSRSFAWVTKWISPPLPQINGTLISGFCCFCWHSWIILLFVLLTWHSMQFHIPQLLCCHLIMFKGHFLSIPFTSVAFLFLFVLLNKFTMINSCIPHTNCTKYTKQTSCIFNSLG